MSQSRKQTPSDFLKQIIGRPVVVKLNSGIDYRGLLTWSVVIFVAIELFSVLTGEGDTLQFVSTGDWWGSSPSNWANLIAD